MSETLPFANHASLAASLAKLLARAETRRECLTLRSYGSFNGVRWEAYFTPRKLGGYADTLDDALAALDSAVEQTPKDVKVSWNASQLAELIGQAIALTPSFQRASVHFVADFRKRSGNVFKAEASTTAPANQAFTNHKRGKKLGNDATATLGEALGKAGLL